MTIIANIYVYILDDKFGIQNPQIMAIGKLMNRGCERESKCVQGHKSSQQRKGKQQPPRFQEATE